MSSLTHAVQSWLESCDYELQPDLEELKALIDQHPYDWPRLPAEPLRAIALRNGGDEWELYLAVSPWVGGGTKMQGDVVRVSIADGLELSDWSTLRERRECWIRPDSGFVGLHATGAAGIPLHFDGAAWEGTTESYAEGCGEFMFDLNGDTDYIHADAMDLRYEHLRVGLPTGRLLHVECTDLDPHEGDPIELTVDVHPAGGLVIYHVHGLDAYTERVDAHTDLVAVLDRYLPDFVPSNTDAISSAILGSDGLRPFLDWIERRDPHFDADKVTIQCVGLSRTAAEIRALRQ